MWKKQRYFQNKYFLSLFETIKKSSSKSDVAWLDKPSRGQMFLSVFFVLQFFQRLPVACYNFSIKFSFYDLNQPYWPGKSFLQVHI